MVVHIGVTNKMTSGLDMPQEVLQPVFVTLLTNANHSEGSDEILHPRSLPRHLFFGVGHWMCFAPNGSVTMSDVVVQFALAARLQDAWRGLGAIWSGQRLH
jgi:hypothetical protein